MVIVEKNEISMKTLENNHSKNTFIALRPLDVVFLKRHRVSSKKNDFLNFFSIFMP